MAKQIGALIIKGGIDNFIFYERNGKYFLRKKGYINGKKVHTEANFSNTNRHCGQLGIASKIAASIYWKIDKKERSGELFNSLTGVFKVQLAEGRMEDEIRKDVQDNIYQLRMVKEARFKMKG
jgi:hypothetical protein